LKAQIRTIGAAVLAAALLAGGLCLAVHAQSLLNESGQATLADAYGTATGPEALTVNWSVVENGSDIYTYSYTIQNPPGDVLLGSGGSPTLSPEIVDAFSVGFDTTAAGAYVAGSQAGGTSDQNNGVNGLFWYFAAVNPGSSSPALTFESYLAPGLGNANAQDGNPPSPWASDPNGQQVPVPLTLIVPDSTPTIVLLAAILLAILLFRFAIFKRT